MRPVAQHHEWLGKEAIPGKKLLTTSGPWALCFWLVWHGEKPSGDRALSGSVPAETPGALHHGRGSGQRVRGGEAEQSSPTHDGALAEVRTDRTRRGWYRWRMWVRSFCLGSIERAERAALIVTTNLPFSEWTTVFPNPRLCKALLDRVTDRAHIIETGTESFRFRRTMERRKKR